MTFERDDPVLSTLRHKERNTVNDTVNHYGILTVNHQESDYQFYVIEGEPIMQQPYSQLLIEAK